MTALIACQDGIDPERIEAAREIANERLGAAGDVLVDVAGVLDESLADNAESERAAAEREAGETLVDEASAAMDETYAALEALEQADEAAALAALERGIGKLEVLLARQPDASVVPLEVSTEIVNPGVLPETVEMLSDRVAALVDDGDFQAARRALEAMASEIRISTVQLPLATYPVAMKKAVRQIDDGSLEAAQETLHSALSTLVIVHERIPLPVVNAQHLIRQAAEKPVAERADALALLSRAQQELQLAESLGYGFRERDWAELDAEISSLKEAVEAEEESGGMFDALLENLRNFRGRLSDTDET